MDSTARAIAAVRVLGKGSPLYAIQDLPFVHFLCVIPSVCPQVYSLAIGGKGGPSHSEASVDWVVDHGLSSILSQQKTCARPAMVALHVSLVAKVARRKWLE